MKVVLFCGGQGTRLRSGVAPPPKPMTLVGGRPLLWHVMRYYAHHGHDDFVLCLGHRGAVVRDWFVREARLDPQGEVARWRIVFADTGESSPVGQRLCQVRQHLAGEELFLANYGDTLTDAPLDDVVDRFRSSGATVSLLAVRPQESFHVLQLQADLVREVRPVSGEDLWQNGGGFVMRQGVFDVIGPGEDLVEEPFARLGRAGQLLAYRYEGFWAPLDTVKDRLRLEALWAAGAAPWAVWESAPLAARA